MAPSSGNFILSEFQQSIIALQGLKNKLEPAVRSFKRHSADKEARIVIVERIHILVCSFLDEWGVFTWECRKVGFHEPLDTAMPALKRIRIWRGLDRVRSSLLAHPFRDKSNVLVNPGSLYGVGKSPSCNAEVCLLGECAIYACAVAAAFTQEEHARAMAILGDHWPDIDPGPSGVDTLGEVESEIGAVRAAILVMEPALALVFDGKVASFEAARRATAS